MKVVKISTNANLTCSTLDWAVQTFVEEFGGWPVGVIAALESGYDDVWEHAKRLNLARFIVPPAVTLKQDAWAVVGNDGETIWSPGA